MKNKQIFLFDESLEGLLTAVFEWFERKPGAVILSTSAHSQPDAFSSVTRIHSDPTKADRVWRGLSKRLDKSWMRRLYCAFLSEQHDAYNALFNLITYLFSQPSGNEKNYGNADVLAVAQTAKKVEREKHRMEAFIRFQQTDDGIFYCGIAPDFNVLPLILSHFRDRYADQQWIIYDIKRKYGLFYDLKSVEQVTFESNSNLPKPKTSQLNGSEKGYADLWKNYFRSTNIESRKNTKLHLKHIPKRYWRYLTEKMPD